MLLQSRVLKALLATLLLAAPVAVSAQVGRPAVEYRSLLNMSFVEADGDLVIDGLHIVFPPPGYDQALVTITTAAGEEVASVPLRLESDLNFPVFSKFVPEAKPTTIKLGKPGEYVLTIKMADDAITRFSFGVGAEPSDNPYDAPKKFWREGPWRDFGYFSMPANDVSRNMRFNWWMSVRELPLGMTNPSITIHLIEGYKEIAVSRGEIRLDNLDWQFFSTQLVKTKKPGTAPMTMRELVDSDRVYLLIVKADGKPIKSFRLETRNGRLQRAEQSRIDFEPHADFISPRFIESRGQSGSDYLVTDAYWVRRSGVRRSFPPTFAPDATDQNQRISRKEPGNAQRAK